MKGYTNRVLVSIVIHNIQKLSSSKESIYIDIEIGSWWRDHSLVGVDIHPDMWTPRWEIADSINIEAVYNVKLGGLVFAKAFTIRSPL